MALEGWEPANRWGYRAENKREQLAAANEIDPGDVALPPHDILSYLKYPELEQDVDVKWKKMVKVYLKQGEAEELDWTADFGKVFDVILEEAVNANLKPDKMVKKVLALTTYKHFLTGSNFSFLGETKMSPFLLVSATTFTSPKLSFL
ncbi:hypothetical protein ACFX11_036467 [Malus domestica]